MDMNQEQEDIILCCLSDTTTGDDVIIIFSESINYALSIKKLQSMKRQITESVIRSPTEHMVALMDVANNECY